MSEDSEDRDVHNTCKIRIVKEATCAVCHMRTVHKHRLSDRSTAQYFLHLLLYMHVSIY